MTGVAALAEVSVGVAGLADLDAALDALAATEFAAVDDRQVLAALRGLEVVARRIESIGHALVAQVEARGMADARGCSSSTVMLAQLLRISRADASTRVRASRQLAPRTALSGEPLEPAYPQLAAAQAEGAVSREQAGIITRMIEALPAQVRAEQAPALEATLAAYARQFGPEQLRMLARKAADCVDPDGTLTEAADREHNRRLSVFGRGDGSAHGTFDLTAEAAEALLTVLDTLAAPTPADGGVPDVRTAAQRRHDGLRDGLLALIRSGQLPASGGVTTTMVITMTAEQLATGTGLATTSHGATLPVKQALKLLAESRILPVTLDDGGALAGYGQIRRLFTERQRLAMFARDKGCAFPGCTVPAAWTEANHVIPYATEQRTCVDQGCLLCPYHHRLVDRQGWTCHMQDGKPAWSAPEWLEPDWLNDP